LQALHWLLPLCILWFLSIAGFALCLVFGLWSALPFDTGTLVGAAVGLFVLPILLDCQSANFVCFIFPKVSFLSDHTLGAGQWFWQFVCWLFQYKNVKCDQYMLLLKCPVTNTSTCCLPRISSLWFFSGNPPD